MKRHAFIASGILILSGCGPNAAVVRQYLATSPHRSVAVLPFDQIHGQVNYDVQATDVLEGKLRRAGFAVADSKRTRVAFNRARLKDHIFDDLAAAAAIGAQLGVKAVWLGAVDEAYERLENRPAVSSYQTIFPPACCSAVPPRCTSVLVFDPMLNAYVDSCSVRHRRVTLTPARRVRSAGFAARARVVDVATQKILWEEREQDDASDNTLANSTDRVTDYFAERFVEDTIKQKF